MSITSHAFGRVTLTGRDAKKFRDHVNRGRPSKAAIDGVKSGMQLARRYEKSGKISITLKIPRR